MSIVSLYSDSARGDDSAGPAKVAVSGPERNRPAPADRMLYAEDLAVGDCWTSHFCEISSDDVQDFAKLTGDHTPLHGQGETDSPFGGPIAHGLLGLSVLAGLGTKHPRASTLALVGIENWQFVAPVYFGDSVKARNEIVEIEQHGRRAVKVRWLRQLLNSSGQIVQQGHFVTLVGSSTRAGHKPR
ncbi:acyl dehydratase [Stieleria sp. TO1_6]|uniref:MaoC family dehydratase n=1 Tax=Stieleria tagensis TaxID=2956795 RepID=UPI00209B6394|nr:MaoC/PaaZ C-terminal domain-containing protein [Stieleria tagensis]MCO8120486.1 acyl dehydratase [Stieleria tagensis]